MMHEMILGISSTFAFVFVVFLAALLIFRHKGKPKLKISGLDKIVMAGFGVIIVLIILLLTFGYRILIFAADKKVENDFYEDLLKSPNMSYENGICFTNNELQIWIDDKYLDNTKNVIEAKYNGTLYPTTFSKNDYKFVLNSHLKYNDLSRVSNEIQGMPGVLYSAVKTTEYGHRQQYREEHRRFHSKERIIKECIEELLDKR